ncbi:MAG: hypothetical protein GXP61_02295 [Epsilonproteobacteria bacterium]|nr:hypothetical protein [Campylobacterota bacterium]
MSKFPTQKTIIDATIRGISKAKDNFIDWTNGRLYLSHAPAKMLSIHVAQEIAKIKNAPEIFIDACVSDILRCSLENRDGFLDYMDKNSISEGVFSITLDEKFKHTNNNDSISRVIITVKNGIRDTKGTYLNEIKRICLMLNSSKEENSTLDYGILAFYSDLPNSARKKLSTRIPLIVQNFDEIVRKFPNLKSNFQDNTIQEIKDIGEWVIGAYTIQKF